MIPIDWTDLVRDVAHSLVPAMALDVWHEVRQRLVSLLAWGNPDQREVTERRLDRDRDRVCSSSDDDRANYADAVAANWQLRLTDLLEDHPDAADELARLAELMTDALGKAKPAGSSSEVITAIADNNSQNIIRSGPGDGSVNITYRP